jgi:hypothetical protein
VRSAAEPRSRTPEVQFTTIYRDPRDCITTFGVTEDIFSVTVGAATRFHAIWWS